MGGPWTIPEVESIIVETWMDMSSKELNPTAKEIRAKVRQQLNEAGKSHLHVPGIRKTQDIIRETRNSYDNRPEREKKLDNPWSIGSLKDFPLSPDTLPHVLRVWKFCLIRGELLTIRQANWVAQLSHCGSTVYGLWAMAASYARKEQASVSLREPLFETLGLDSSWTQGLWESATASSIGRKHWGRGSSRFSSMFDEKTVNVIVHEAEQSQFPHEEDTVIPFDEQRSHFHNQMLEMDDINTLGLTDEAIIVYSLWLSYLKKGSKWRRLKAGKRITIVKQLRNWVQNQANILASFLESDYRPYEELSRIVEGRPEKLLKLVGYEEE